MGCACGKSRKSRYERLKGERLRQVKSKKIATGSLNIKISVCISCPSSKQTKDEKKKGIKICHKANRLINNIVKDTKFKCPLKRWQ